MARSEAWPQFVSEWDTIYDEEEVPKPFHMVDFVHQKEDFKGGWESEDKRLRVLDRLLCAIEKIQAMPIGGAVVLDGFRNLGDSQRQRSEALTSSRFNRWRCEKLPPTPCGPPFQKLPIYELNAGNVRI